jgi:chromosome segregation ATPase
MHRFELAVPAKKTASLVVKEQSVQTQGVLLLNTDITQLIAYTKTGEIPASVRAAIGKAADLAGVVNDLDRQLTVHTKQIADIGTEQVRIRENMKTVGQNSQYYQRLLTKLNDQESSIEKLQRERDDLQSKRDGARKELENYLSDLTVG